MIDNSYPLYWSITGLIFGLLCIYSGIHCFVFYKTKEFDDIFALKRILMGITITVASFYLITK